MMPSLFSLIFVVTMATAAVIVPMTTIHDARSLGDEPVVPMETIVKPKAAKPVNVMLYYESLCPWCVDFVTVELANTWAKLKASGIMDVHLIPYGNSGESKESGRYEFTCDHGELECVGNMLQTCLIKHHPKFDHHFGFIACFEELLGQKTEIWEDALTQCASHTGIPAAPIKACVTGDEGWQLEHQMALRTGPHKYVPWIILDGVHTPRAQKDLLVAVCKVYKGPKPAACQSGEINHAQLFIPPTCIAKRRH